MSSVFLSLIIFLPCVGALLLCVIPRLNQETSKLVSFLFTIAVFLMVCYMLIPSGSELMFAGDTAEMQHEAALAWIPSFDIFYYLGMDGISFPLVLLTAGISMLAMWASWNIEKNTRVYCVLFLVLLTGMLGVFMALDFFLFYVFWEVMLLPMYFLIGIWGGPRKEYAAIKFFLYTLFGSILMLIAILMLYFSSDLTDPRLQAFVADDPVIQATAGEKIAEATAEGLPVHTFNILALQKCGQLTDQFDAQLLGISIQHWAFILLFIGFVIKVPSVPVHTWLPDAHVEAPTPISMILAGVLLKMGGYGIIRICYPICPEAGYDLAYFVALVGVVSIVYGAFAALAQTDFKRLVAYSSVSHMGYVVLGLAVWSANPAFEYNPAYWAMGMNGAMFQMIAHGISSAGMFFMVGVVYDRVHHRDLDKFGGLFHKMPVYSGLAFGIFFAGLGLPGLCGFIGEVFVVLSVWNYDAILAVVSASAVILTAGYILWTLQRVYLGPEYKGPHAEDLKPITARELGIAAPLLALAIFFGVYPQAIFYYMEPSVTQTAEDLAGWTKDVKTAKLREAERVREAETKEQLKEEKAKAVKAEGADSDADLAARGNENNARQAFVGESK